MSDPDFSKFKLLPKGNDFEDFPVGRVFDHHWGRTLTVADNALFTTTTLSYLPMYFNAEFARAHGHPNVVIHPMLVLCIAVGMSVEDLSEGGGPFLGVNQVKFHRPVYPEDTITARSVVVSTRKSTSRQGEGIVTWRTEASNQRDEIVLCYERTNLTNLRAGSASR